MQLALEDALPLTADVLEHDAACPPVAGLELGNVALRIAAEDDLAHRQRPGEGVPVGVRQRDRSEATVPDDQLPALDTQVVERLELLAEVATCEAGEVHRRFLCDASARVLPVLLEGDSLH